MSRKLFLKRNAELSSSNCGVMTLDDVKPGTAIVKLGRSRVVGVANNASPSNDKPANGAKGPVLPVKPPWQSLCTPR